MKLLYCETCGDVFRLGVIPRACKCGKAAGYVPNHLSKDAVHNGKGTCIALSSHDLFAAARVNKPMPDDVRMGVRALVFRPRIGRVRIVRNARKYPWKRDLLTLRDI